MRQLGTVRGRAEGREEAVDAAGSDLRTDMSEQEASA